jgi:HAD superfamily hydrolase (TIGR01484 family)
MCASSEWSAGYHLKPSNDVTPSPDLIALDLDGTLLAPDETVSPANRAAIDRALRAGIRVVLVTGRGVDTPIRVSRELGLNLPVICCHGALTKDFGANRTLAHLPVPLAQAKRIIRFAERHAHSIAIYAEESFWRIPGATIHMPDMAGPGWRVAPSLADVLRRGAPTFIRFLGKPSVEAMMAEFGHLPLSFRLESWFDFQECAVLNREASKEHALAQLCSDLRIPAERVLAIGDSRNDVPMLQWAGIGVAMENALPEVRAAVPYVTASHDRDGVALAIERFAFAAERKSA